MCPRNSPAKRLFNRELKLAQEFAETLAPTEGQGSRVVRITSGSASGGYNRKGESKNWFYAVGGYAAWGKGKVKIEPIRGTKRCKFTLDFEYKFKDRYNWDTGKKVTILGVEITDEFMGRFHKQGLAKEFEMHGTISKRVTWISASGGGGSPQPPPGAGRD